MEKSFKWRLQPFSGRESRFRCPNCGKAQQFTRYILSSDFQDGKITYAGEEYGVCNRKTCGYSRYPDKEARYETIEAKPEAPKFFYDRSTVTSFHYNWANSELMQYLSSKIDPEKLEEACHLYAVGTLRDGNICIDKDSTPKKYKTFYNGTIFWQVDQEANIHRGKVMFYRPDGHREKINDRDGAIMAMWQVCRRKRENEPDMCYFGQHLIRKFPDRHIALVESEKTAIVASCYLPQFTWMACGSINNFNAERLAFISKTGLAVVVYPDYDGYAKWEEKARDIRPLFPNNIIRINDSIIKHGEGKQDIADILLS